jgi:hypothetical protein
MNSYVNLILDAESAKERLQRLFQFLNNAPQVFSIADTDAEQIERTTTRYSHGLIRYPFANWYFSFY